MWGTFMLVNKIWGMNTVDVIKYGKWYSIYSKVVYLIDILAVIICVKFMLDNGVMFGDYVRFMLIIYIFAIIALNIPLKEDKYRAYKFLVSNKKCVVKSLDILVSSDDLYRILYKLNKRKLMKCDTVENYMNIINSCCSLNKKYPVKVFRMLSELKLKQEQQSTGVLLHITYSDNNKSKYAYIDYEVSEVVKDGVVND